MCRKGPEQTLQIKTKTLQNKNEALQETANPLQGTTETLQETANLPAKISQHSARQTRSRNQATQIQFERRSSDLKTKNIESESKCKVVSIRMSRRVWQSKLMFQVSSK